jgi:hypothetical protein
MFLLLFSQISLENKFTTSSTYILLRNPNIQAHLTYNRCFKCQDEEEKEWMEIDMYICNWPREHGRLTQVYSGVCPGNVRELGDSTSFQTYYVKRRMM